MFLSVCGQKNCGLKVLPVAGDTSHFSIFSIYKIKMSNKMDLSSELSVKYRVNLTINKVFIVHLLSTLPLWE